MKITREVAAAFGMLVSRLWGCTYSRLPRRPFPNSDAFITWIVDQMVYSDQFHAPGGVKLAWRSALARLWRSGPTHSDGEDLELAAAVSFLADRLGWEVPCPSPRKTRRRSSS